MSRPGKLNRNRETHRPTPSLSLGVPCRVAPQIQLVAAYTKEFYVITNLKQTATQLRAAGFSTVAEMLVLSEVAEATETGVTGVAVTGVCRGAKLPISTGSRVVFSLCQRGLMQISSHKTDRRIRLVSLTKRGRELVSKALR